MEKPEALIVKKWYAVYTKPMQEQIALSNLERQAYICYLPMIKTVKQRCSMIIRPFEPMFPRYLFVELNLQSDNSASIRSTRGVCSLVRFGDYTAVIPTYLIGALKQRESDNRFDPPARTLNKGDPVRIVDGALSGCQGIFEAASGRERVTLLLEFAGQSARVQTNANQLEQVN